jgi:hypothetical protein
VGLVGWVRGCCSWSSRIIGFLMVFIQMLSCGRETDPLATHLMSEKTG